MFGRLASKRLSGLSRSFAHDYTYTASSTKSGPCRATLIPGIYVGPETTSNFGFRLECMLRAFEAINTPIEFDIID